jgi:hypothetical protein
MDLAALENKTRAEKCKYEAPNDPRPPDIIGEKQKKIGEGTFANVYKGEPLIAPVPLSLANESGVERATGRKSQYNEYYGCHAHRQSLSRRSRRGK